MYIFHRSAIPCTSTKGGAINTTNLISKGGASNISNLFPHNETSSYLYTSHITSHTNAFCCPNQTTPRPNIQGVALLLKSGTQSGYNLATH